MNEVAIPICASDALEEGGKGIRFPLTVAGGLYLMCSTHGAIYTPDTGRCAGGPCRGGRLRPITVFEKDNQVFWEPDDYIKPAMA
jgi:hypothetical protein